jgi:hypothetical protein
MVAVLEALEQGFVGLHRLIGEDLVITAQIRNPV